MAKENAVTKTDELDKVDAAGATTSAKKSPKKRKRTAKKKTPKKRKKKAKKRAKKTGKKARRADPAAVRPEQAAQTVDAVEESVRISSLRVFERTNPIEQEVATRVASEPQAAKPIAAESDPKETSPEELSAEEALEMLAAMSGQRKTAGGRLRRPRPRGSVIMPSCKVIAFESPAVDSAMRVATTTVARLYGLVREEQLDLELGRICQTVDDLVDEWDTTAIGQTVILVVNLIGAADFLQELFAEVPEVTEAYWIVYETLRGEVTSAKNCFLAEQRAKKHAKAIGFGPRNVVAAARTGAEAVRWRVTWGRAGRFAARAS